jgi:hypothetical protein
MAAQVAFQGATFFCRAFFCFLQAKRRGLGKARQQ